MNQIMLSVGAMALLSVVILTLNRSVIGTDEDILKAEVGITAVSLGNSLIEEAAGKAFDQLTDTAAVSTTSSLTPVAALGSESGETYEHFNDFDDFNGYSQTISLRRSGTFTISSTVSYVNPSTPTVPSSVPTWHKKMTVSVSSPSMQDTLTMELVFSYWYFR